MKRSAMVLAFFVFLPSSAFAENKVLDLFFPDHAASIAYFDVGAFYAPIGAVAQGGLGLNFNAGLNLGRLFHNKLVVAPFVGVAPCFFDTINPSFIRDLRENYTMPERLMQLEENGYETQQDIEVGAAYLEGVSLLDYLLAGEDLEKFTITMRYGVLLQIPWRYFPPIALYGLYCGTAIKPTSTRTGYDTYESGAAGLSAFGYGMEIYLFRGPILISEDGIVGSFHAGSVALMVEMTDLKNAIVVSKDEYYETPDIYLREFTTAEFQASHPYDWRISLNFNIHIF